MIIHKDSTCACKCVCVWQGRHGGFFSKWMEPSFSRIHGNGTLRSTGSEARGAEGGEGGEREGFAGDKIR